MLVEVFIATSLIIISRSFQWPVLLSTGMQGTKYESGKAQLDEHSGKSKFF